MRYIKLIDKIILAIFVELLLILLLFVKVTLEFLADVLMLFATFCNYIKADCLKLQVRLARTYIYLKAEIKNLCNNNIEKRGNEDEKRK